MTGATTDFGRRGAAIHALSGADIALWDLLGKATGLPVCQLLAARTRSACQAYSSDLMPFVPAEAEARAASLREAGFTHMKFGWGGLGRSEAEDVALVGAARRGSR